MRRILLSLALPAALLAQPTASPEASREFFESRIRPVLAQQCFVCHTNSKMGGLRLDTRGDLMKGGKSGPAVVPGDPDKSLLISAIRHAGGLAMPKGAVKLTDSQVSDFTQWVKEGANWPVEVVSSLNIKAPRFWSIQPLSQAPPPKVKDMAWPMNNVDRFVLAGLEKDGLKPAPLADRRTLLRRVTYDLTGLPPSIAEVTAFEADKSPNAFEKVVDRLLASPRYGERWARHWMDVVRYAEDDYNVGGKPDRTEKYPQAFHYRDWLIESFNEDIPYDKFVKAQLAADLMPAAERDKMLRGLGMHGTGVWKFEDNPAPIERADEWHDKVDVTTKAFLGLTVGCARCHDHKYDPIPAKDYYRLAGVFASSRFKAYPMTTKDVVEVYDKQKKELEAKEERLKKFEKDASDLYAQMLVSQTERYMMAAWRLGKQKRATTVGVAEKERLDLDVLERWARFLKKKPYNYPYLKDWQSLVDSNGTEEQAAKLAKAFAETVGSVDKEYTELRIKNEAELARLKNADEQFDPLPNGKKRRLNKHQIELKSLPREKTYLWRDIFETDLPENPGNPNAEDKKQPGLLKLDGWFLEKRLSADLANYLQILRADIEAFKKAMPEHYPFVYGIEEDKEPTDLKVFVRGNPYSFGEDAPRGFLSFLSNGEEKLFSKGSGRMELAESILAHPLSSRVMVNRIWQWHMGAPLVDTPSNFGLVGGRPSNPELLDYLARQFQAEGMSWKKLHKEILLSRTYQLSSQAIEANLAKDPANKRLWRANRRRLEVEPIWDSLLTVGGNLDVSKLGGKSDELNEKMKRRAVYAKVSRMYPNEVLSTFDFPTATISIEKRYTTNVPQQRLFFLNNEFVHRQAEAVAERARKAGGEEAQVKAVYEITLQRQPTAAEFASALELLRSEPVTKAAPAAVQSAGMALKPAPEPLAIEPTTDKEKAASKIPQSPLKSLCWALLSSNEFLYLN